MNHEDIRMLFAGALYGELTGDEQGMLDAHLAVCPTCATELKKLRDTLDLMNRRTREEPREKEWSGYWERLSARLDEPNEETRPRVNLFPSMTRLPAWAYGIAALLLVGFGIYLGRFYVASHDSAERSIAAANSHGALPVESDSLQERTLAYLERSRNLLIGVVNRDPASGSFPGLSRQQEASRQLLEQAGFLKIALNKPDQQVMRQLVLDLEVILLQLANMEVKPGVPAIELVKKGVDQKSILLKINLEEMRASAKRSSAAIEHNSNHVM